MYGIVFRVTRSNTTHTSEGHFGVVCLETPFNTEGWVVGAGLADNFSEVPLSSFTSIADCTLCSLSSSVPWQGSAGLGASLRSDHGDGE